MIAGLIFKSNEQFFTSLLQKQPSILEYSTNGLRTDHFKQTVTW